MKLSPAEKMHSRILNGSVFSTRDVTADDFRKVAQRAGTLGLPDIRAALNKLQMIEKTRQA